MDDPIMGCHPIMDSSGNSKTFIYSLLSFLQICSSSDTGLRILARIEKESKKIAINRHEYIINEMQYMFRFAKVKHNEIFNESLEDLILRNWTKKVIKKYGEDVGLPFYGQVVANRIARKRIKLR